MKIKDMDGRPITVTNLKDAINQAAFFKNLQHDDPAFSELDNYLKTYWTDFYNKLIELKNKEGDL